MFVFMYKTKSTLMTNHGIWQQCRAKFVLMNTKTEGSFIRTSLVQEIGSFLQEITR